MSAPNLEAALSVLDPADAPRLFVLKIDEYLSKETVERIAKVWEQQFSQFGVCCVLGRGHELSALTGAQLRDLGLVRIGEIPAASQ